MAAKSTPARPATRADLEALPAHVKGEIIQGVLHTQPRPRARHQNAEGLLHDDIKSRYQRGRGGPGGWWILAEPGIELPEAAEISPDLAGWRKERTARLPDDGPIRVVPDWVCELLSPSTRGYDQRTKRPFYAEIGVGFLWYVDLEAKTLTASKLEGGRWLEVGVWGNDDVVRVAPFEEAELALGESWG